jgi:hypothetical protein
LVLCNKDSGRRRGNEGEIKEKYQRRRRKGREKKHEGKDKEENEELGK